MYITIDETDRRPFYRQVADEIKALIARGELREGSSLPPVRQVAADLGVNLNTVAFAYRTLQADSNFKAAIFDMMMPFLEGIDVIRHMRTENRLRRIPVMMITSESDPKVMIDSFAAGATLYLPKPFTPEQLHSTLGMLFSRRVFA